MRIAYAFGVVRKSRGVAQLATSARWNWDEAGERFVYGEASFRLPSADKLGPARVAMLNEPWDGYGEHHIAYDIYVPLPQRFVCRGCEETVIVNTP